jgi:hypothetical protein
LQSKNNTPPQDGLLSGKLVHLALPVRWSLVEERGRGPVETACTYDIHPRGARLVGTGEVNAGDLVLVERGRNKAICQVVWTGDSTSDLRGQFESNVWNRAVRPGTTNCGNWKKTINRSFRAPR